MNALSGWGIPSLFLSHPVQLYGVHHTNALITLTCIFDLSSGEVASNSLLPASLPIRPPVRTDGLRLLHLLYPTSLRILNREHMIDYYSAPLPLYNPRSSTEALVNVIVCSSISPSFDSASEFYECLPCC